MKKCQCYPPIMWKQGMDTIVFLSRDKLKKPGHRKVFRSDRNHLSIFRVEIFESKVIRKGLMGCLLDTAIILNNEFRSRVKLAPHSDDKIDRLGLGR